MATADVNLPDPIHLPTPAEAIPARPWEPKQLVRLTPEELERYVRPAARHRMPGLRVARRAGRGRGL